MEDFTQHLGKIVFVAIKQEQKKCMYNLMFHMTDLHWHFVQLEEEDREKLKGTSIINSNVVHTSC